MTKIEMDGNWRVEKYKFSHLKLLRELRENYDGFKYFTHG
jgi:hypothetical protein